MIRVEGVTIGFDEPLFEDVDFEVGRGEIFGILGRSGTGKSVLVRHLIGLHRPWSGRIEIEGVGAPRLEPDRPPRFGAMFEGGALLGSLTVAENLALPLRRWTDLPRDAVDTVVRWKLRMVGLAGAGHLLPGELSSGMRQRAGVARAQVLEPPLIFLDEPWSGLDPVTAVEMDDLLATLNRTLGTTLVVVTHNLAGTFNIVDRCVLLDREARGVIARGDPRRLRDQSDDPRVRCFFNREGPGGAADSPPGQGDGTARR